MADLSIEAYDAYVLQILCQSLEKIYNLDQLLVEGFQTLITGFKTGKPFSVDDVYQEILTIGCLTETHRYILTLLMNLESSKVARKRFERILSVRESLSKPYEIVLLNTDERTRSVPDFIKQLCSPIDKLSYPSSAIVSIKPTAFPSNVVEILTYGCSKSEIDVMFIAALYDCIQSDESLNKSLSCLCSEWLQRPLIEIKPFDSFLNVIERIVTDHCASFESANLLARFTSHIPELFNHGSNLIGSYELTYNTVSSMEKILCILGSANCPLRSNLEKNQEDGGKMSYIYTILFHIARAGSHCLSMSILEK